MVYIGVENRPNGSLGKRPLTVVVEMDRCGIVISGGWLMRSICIVRHRRGVNTCFQRKHFRRKIVYAPS